MTIRYVIKVMRDEKGRVMVGWFPWSSQLRRRKSALDQSQRPNKGQRVNLPDLAPCFLLVLAIGNLLASNNNNLNLHYNGRTE